jgi:hypothetical protein
MLDRALAETCVEWFRALSDVTRFGVPQVGYSLLPVVALCDSGVSVSTLAQRHGRSDPQAGVARCRRDQGAVGSKPCSR